ncbi:TfuA domain-containing protein [Rhizobium altiplani]|uniref:TfuA domain-containing protein n=1 Tax=Rhizobium altiplani TaxID=1864509 RepID=A0A125Q9C9_9HYPH|nr:TfuA-like protein [Rhizobium altiplani]KWV56975.1 TfuA domain-containing protein [Rhizobium altiplani]
MSAADQAGPILVFLGPTLRLPEAQAALDAVYLQPVAQGDILLAAHAFRPRAMVIIDGQFEDRPSVRHKEILWALAQGIVVIGAASMGALRAAELGPYGMIGVGLIFRWYRRWVLTPDDAVAVQSGPAELGFPPVTDALIDLQRTFSHLMRLGHISAAQRDSLTATARRMNFRDRSIDRILRSEGWGREEIGRLRQQFVRQKGLDALLALKIAPRLSSESIVHHPTEAWVATNTFIRDLQATNIDIDLINYY